MTFPRPILTALLALALAPAAGAETVRDAVVQVIRGHGCFLAESDAAAAFAPFGLRQEQVLEAVEGMVARGEARRDDAEMTLILSDELCTIEAVRGEIRAALIGVLRSSGCAMTEEEARAAFAGSGYWDVLVLDMGERMVAAGEATLAGDGRLVLTPALCAG
jgi:hypothetical protein